MAKVTVLNTKGKEASSIEIDDAFFGGYVNHNALHQAVVKYQASLRQGNASVKDRGEVSGGGRKPYRQKGTGRARVGSIRSPLYSGGGVTFGPQVRDFSYSIPKKVKKLALQEALKAKYQEGDLICLDDIKTPIEKTKEFAQILKDLSISGKVLVVLDGTDETTLRAARNIVRLTSLRAADVTAYDIMRVKKVLLTKTALENLIKRVEK